MTYILTRLQVGDYDAWKPLFDQDAPRAREAATGYQVLRGVEDPNEVFIRVEFETAADAVEARRRLLASGVLERFTDRNGPTVAEVAA